jgi:hypothetical protein
VHIDIQALGIKQSKNHQKVCRGVQYASRGVLYAKTFWKSSLYAPLYAISRFNSIFCVLGPGFAPELPNSTQYHSKPFRNLPKPVCTRMMARNVFLPLTWFQVDGYLFGPRFPTRLNAFPILSTRQYLIIN